MGMKGLTSVSLKETLKMSKDRMTTEDCQGIARNLDAGDLERLYAHLRVEMNAVFTEDQVRHLDRSVDRDGIVREGSFG